MLCFNHLPGCEKTNIISELVEQIGCLDGVFLVYKNILIN